MSSSPFAEGLQIGWSHAQTTTGEAILGRKPTGWIHPQTAFFSAWAAAVEPWKAGRPMRHLFVEFPGFSEVVEYYLENDEGYAQLQTYLSASPEAGTVLSGTGGIRKLRWADPRRGKGKRSGLRILYLHLPSWQRFLMLDMYAKDEAEDLSHEQKRRLTLYIMQYERALGERKRRQ
jgi:hypothetical protein